MKEEVVQSWHLLLPQVDPWVILLVILQVALQVDPWVVLQVALQVLLLLRLETLIARCLMEEEAVR